MTKSIIRVNGQIYTVFHPGRTLHEAYRAQADGSQVFLHPQTQAIFWGSISATRHIFQEVPAGLSDLQQEDPRHSTPGLYHLGSEWELINVRISLGDYVREWYDWQHGAVYNTPTMYPDTGGRLVAGGMTDEHPLFWEMPIEVALKAWLIAKELDQSSIWVLRDEHLRPYVSVNDKEVYLDVRTEGAQVYVFTVRHPGYATDVRETIELMGEFNLEAAKAAIRAKFSNSSGFFFHGVEATNLEQIVADTSFQEPGFGPWK